MTFGIIFTIAGRFFSEGNFSQKLGLCHAKPNKLSNTIASFRKKYVSSEKSYERMDVQPPVEVQKVKKGTEQCTKDSA